MRRQGRALGRAGVGVGRLEPVHLPSSEPKGGHARKRVEGGGEVANNVAPQRVRLWEEIIFNVEAFELEQD